MKRINQITKELNITLDRLKVIFKRINYEYSSPNEKLSDDLIEKILIEIKPKPKTELKKTQPKTISNTLTNPNQKNIIEIITSNDVFSQRKIVQNEYNGIFYNTIFTDFEAFSIVSGIENNKARRFSKTYFKNNNKENTIYVHNLAMDALEKYGSQLLSYFIKLPPLPFKVPDAQRIFSELDKQKKSNEFPVLRFLYKNERNENEKMKICFYSEKHNDTLKRNDNLIIVKNGSTKKTLFKIDRKGVVYPEPNCKQIIPVMQVFIRFTNNSKNMILNYGLETGECSICGRELTDSMSISKGIGPVCLKYL